MIAALGQRWLALLATIMGLLLLSPSPTSQAFRLSLKRAAIAVRAGQIGGAAEALTEALQIETELPSLQRQTIELYLQSGQPQRAQELIAHWELAEAECFQFQADLLAATPAEAASLLQARPSSCPPDLGRLEELAIQATDAGEVRIGLALESEILRWSPDDMGSIERSALLLTLTEPEEAPSALRRALELPPEDPSLLRDLLTAALEGQPGDSEAYFMAQVGQAFARHQRWPLAQEAFERALSADPAYTEARAYHGLALDQNGGDGLQQLTVARRQAPAAPLPAAFLGLHWLEAGQPERALPLLAHAARLDASNPALQAQVAAAHAASGDLQSALIAYSQAANLAPQDPNFWHLLADFSLRHELEIASTGLPAARQAYDLAPSALGADSLGYAHLLLGHPDLAARLLARSLELDPNSGRALYHRGLLALETGDLVQGRHWLERALEADSQGPYGELASRTLTRIRDWAPRE